MKRLFAPGVVVALAAIALQACVSTPRAAYLAGSTQEDECVVLIHGLNRSWRAMEPMAERLRDAGWSVVNVDYPSQAGPVEVIAPMAVGTGLEQCRAGGANRVHFVTHSIGGILVRYSHHTASIPDLGRVVMLGTAQPGQRSH